MFYLLSLLSMIGYGIQTSLLAHISRKMDALDMSMYRNLSFILTLSPLLLFVTVPEIVEVFQYWPELLLMAFMAGLSMWGIYFSFRYLPIGIAFSIRSAMVAVFIAILSYIIFAEALSFWAILLILGAIGATLFLTLQKNHMPHLNQKTMVGITSLVVTAIPASATIFMAASLARKVNPFVAGYAWEVSIGLAIVVMVILRALLTKKKFKLAKPKEIGRVALASWPTLIGTGAFTLAVTKGDIAIVSAIGLASVVVATLMAHFFFHEKLNLKQWLGITVLILIVGGMNFV